MKPLLYSVLARPPHPARDGSAIRNYYLLRAFAQEFRVRVFVLLPPHLREAGEFPPSVEVETLPQAPRFARRLRALAGSFFSGNAYSPLLYSSAAMRSLLRAALEREKPVWIVAHSYHVGPDALEVSRSVWVDFHNLDSEIWRRVGETSSSSLARSFARMQEPRVEACERSLLMRAAGVSCVSERDAERIRKLLPEARPLTVPNGVDFERYSFRPEPAREEVVFFVGDLSWPPNAEAILWFRQEVWPRLKKIRPAARAEILGRGAARRFLRRSEADFLFLGEGGDTRPHWKRAAVAVVPLRAAGGTRLKILEAAACGVPVVSTRLGAEGLALREGTEILLRDDPESFAAAIASLLADPMLRRRQAAAARARIEPLYDWSHIGRDFAQELARRGEKPVAQVTPPPRPSPGGRG